MFFRHQEGRYRETDRVTRYKLVKSGKHWLRASTSQFGLFKVLRGGIDTAQVTTEVVEDRVSTSITGLDILKGIAAAGTIVGGGIVTQSHVYANEQTAIEKTIEERIPLLLQIRLFWAPSIKTVSNKLLFQHQLLSVRVLLHQLQQVQ